LTGTSIKGLWTRFSQIPTIQVLFSKKKPQIQQQIWFQTLQLTTRAQGSVFFSGENSLIFPKKIGSFFFSRVDFTSFAIIWLNFAKIKNIKQM
jgi:hypothetical protein